MDELATKLRTNVLDTLALVADESAQREYQRQVPNVNVSNELFNLWDDNFEPLLEEFKACFSAAELEALNRFNEVVDQVSSETPQELPALDEFLKSRAWLVLSTAARDTLRSLGEDRCVSRVT